MEKQKDLGFCGYVDFHFGGQLGHFSFGGGARHASLVTPLSVANSKASYSVEIYPGAHYET